MSNEIRRKLGQRIRERRKLLGMSQETLAAEAGLHRTYIGAVERGERNISLDNIVAVSHALRISTSDLLKGID